MMMIKKKVLSLSLVSSLFLSSVGVSFGKDYSLPSADKKVHVNANTKLLKEMSEGVGAIAEASKKALVFVSVAKTVRSYGQIDPFDLFGFGRRQIPAPRQEGLGSGFFIDVDKGYILTNNHVIDGADEINLKLANGKSYEAKVIGSDPDMDVAVVQIKDSKFDRKNISSLVLGDSEELKVGSFVVALGAPFGLEASISFGVVSALGRGSLSITQLGDFIQTDAAINPGNSGGPLVDMNGKVVGINTAIFSKSGGYNGIGFTVPSNLVRRVAQNLINGVKVSRGYIGVYFQRLTEDFIKWLKLPAETTGVIVTQVEANGPASKAGIKPKDVIISIDGKKLENDRDLVNRIGLMKPGSKARLTVIRGGKQFATTIEIGNRPDADLAQNQGDQSIQGTDLGLELSLKNGGLFVEKVDQKSPAFNRLRAEDVILGVERFDFEGMKDQSVAIKNFNRAIKDAKKNKQASVVMRIKRGGGFAFITIDIS